MKYIVYISIFITLLSCNKNEKDKNSVTAYSEEDYYIKTEKNKKIIIVDTMCSFEKKRANTDINKGILKIHQNFMWSKNYRPKKFNLELMSKLLMKYDITIDTTFSDYNSGCIQVSGFERHCYEKTMKHEIEKRFGKNLIDSLCKIVDRQYVINHPNELFEMQDCDHKSIFPDKNKFQDFFKEFDDNFNKSFKYPKKYAYKAEKYFSYTTIDFILEKDGKISNLKVESTFQNKNNKLYENYFENYVRNFVLKVKWIPAMSMGVVVRANFNNTVFHK